MQQAGTKKAGRGVGRRSILTIVWHLLNDPAARYRDLDFGHQQDSHVSARVPRAEYLGDQRASGPRPLRPPRTPSVGSSVVAAPVRGRPCKADGSPHRSLAPIFVRYASVDTAI